MSVYKLYSTECPAEFYVGSTEQKLIDRLYGHRGYGKRYSHTPVYAHLSQFDNKTWTLELVEDNVPPDLLRKREEFWRVKLKATLNVNRAYQTPEQRREQVLAGGRKHNRANPERRRKTAQYVKESQKRSPEKWRAYRRKSYYTVKAKKTLLPFVLASFKRRSLTKNLNVVRADNHLWRVHSEQRPPRIAAPVEKGLGLPLGVV